MKRKSALGTLGLATLMVVGLARGAAGQIIVTPNIDELCKAAATTYRKTLVYVDLSSLRKNETEWGLTLLNKLELGPRESLTVLGVNPSSFEVSEVFDTCYPTLTKSEVDTARKGRGFWETLTTLDPESQQRENVQTFDSRLRNALDKLITAGDKYSQGNRRNILGAIAVDKNRFRDPHAFYRIITYTDGTILDPSISDAGNENQVIRFLSEKYPTSFSGADIWVYGVVAEDKDRPLEAKARIFSAFFLNNWGLLRSFSQSLPQQRNERFQPVTSMIGNFEGGGTQGTVKLAFTTGSGVDLAEAWLAFVVGINSLFVPFQGEYSCDRDKCKLTATSLESIPVWSPTPYFRKGDRLVLEGKADAELQGSLQPVAREVFREGTKDVQYTLKFRRN